MQLLSVLSTEMCSAGLVKVFFKIRTAVHLQIFLTQYASGFMFN